MAWPTLTFEVAFSDDATAAAPTFTDIGSRLLDFSVRRGRDMELNQTETGTLTAVLRNHDRALDPVNTASSFYPNVVPVRQARMKANAVGAGTALVTSGSPTFNGDSTTTIDSTGSDTVRASATLLDETQGWFAIRFKAGFASTADPYAGSAIALAWWADDGNNHIDLIYAVSSDTFRMRRYSAAVAGGDVGSSAQTFAANDSLTVIGAWTSAGTKISVNGGAFVSSAGTTVPVLATTDFAIGHRDDTGNQWIGSAVAWFACGTGTLTDADAAVLNAYGDTDPSLLSFPSAAAVTMVWPAASTATLAPTTYDVFRGDVPDWPQDWKGRVNTVPVQMVDAFDALQIAEFTTSRPAELSGARVGAILDAIGWPAGQRQIDTGQAGLQALNYENANALQALQDVAEWEYGVLFMARNGDVVFHNRHRRFIDTTLQATFSNEPTGGELPLSDAKVVYRRERITNSVFITQNGGSTVSAEDATSKSRYRRRSLSKTVYLSDPNEVQSMAEYLRDTFKDPVVRVEEVIIEPGQEDNLWAQALGREIGDRIRVKIKPPGTGSVVIQSDVVIEGSSHDANGAAKRWQTTFRCSPANAVNYWILGTGQLEVTSGATSGRIGY